MSNKTSNQAIQDYMKKHQFPDHSIPFKMLNEGHSYDDVWVWLKEKAQFLKNNAPKDLPLHKHKPDMTVFGGSLIEPSAIADMNAMLSLETVVGGALMPDAHRTRENGMPVGGVIASKHPVPEWASADLACSVYFSSPESFEDVAHDVVVDAILNNTFFGHSQQPDLEAYKTYGLDLALDELSTELVTKEGIATYNAFKQLVPTQFGTSGDGNHFVEYGYYTRRLGDDQPSPALLSHFGSRGIGAVIAKHFEEVARKQFKMPKGITAAPLMDKQLINDYMAMMAFARKFARHSHAYVHKRLWEAISPNVSADTRHTIVYSVHNFASEIVDSEGNTLYIHRKGATELVSGQRGVIPATMAEGAYIVDHIPSASMDYSYNSASHGAGRVMSRRQAIEKFGSLDVHQHIKDKHNIYLIGGGVDELPAVYKSAKEVLSHQPYIRIVGKFTPTIVRMAEPNTYKRK